MMNTLYYGDNLDILRRYIKDESVDLIYLDPPFNSNATYNVLFAQKDGTQSSAQIQAFEDTWQWDENAVRTYEEEVEKGGPVADALRAFHLLLGGSNMMAYLTMMAPRLMELRRVLKPTGSLYLHCDPTASHYLKILLDMVFGAENYRNEIIWKRTGSHGGAKRWGSIHDTILFYTRTGNYTWNKIFQDYDQSYVENYYRFSDERGKYQLVSLTGPGVSSGDSGKPWKNVDPSKVGRHWAIPLNALKKIIPEDEIVRLSTQDKLEILDAAGLIYWPPKGSIPRQKRYLDEGEGVQIQDIINDINPISSQAKERLGYPTQKPLALLERIIQASSNPGDVVLDPFCGCGTAVVAAQKLGRQWIGIDITHLAISLVKHRLEDAFGDSLQFQVIGEPTTLEEAASLAAQDKYQFQWWALGLVGARPAEGKKGADRGIDGRLYFHDDNTRKTKQVILSVKGGHVTVSMIRDLLGVVERENAQIGVFITLEEPTRPMRAEAAKAGFYHSEVWNRDYPRIQILTIAELLEGKGIDMPPMRQVSQTFKRAKKENPNAGEQMGLIEG
ncbi:MAG TPA: site-specific DNA-methyltransferase [Anaerolineaceae bacterium]|nr:site-specific DNA-methyltransferase [Anaerolineaceae bacterium]